MSNVETAGTYGANGDYGHSSAETSKATDTPALGKRQQQVYNYLSDVGEEGANCSEVMDWLDIGHGSASGALTRLHRDGLVSRLTVKRHGKQVYVLPQWVKGRNESPYRPNAAYRDDAKPMALADFNPTDRQITNAISALGGVKAYPGVVAYQRRFIEALKEEMS